MLSAEEELGCWRAEVIRLAAENTALAAENGALTGENTALRAESGVQRVRIGELEAQVTALSEKVATLARLAFGTSSEKATPRPAAGTDTGAGGEAGAGVDGGGSAGSGEQSSRRRRGQQPGSPGHGRRDYSHLPTDEEIHDVPECERVCPHCGADYLPFAEDSCEQIDWQVRLTRTVHRRPAYRRGCRCPVPKVLQAPPVGKAIAKGRFTTGFLARLLVEKFVLGRPAHRIAAALANEGLPVSEGTLAGVFAALSPLLAPLADQIGARNATAGHLHADETRWQVFAQVEGKDSHRWWLWVFLGPDTTVFTIARSRSLAVIRDHLGLQADDTQLPGGRQLLLSSDFYAVYQSLGALDGVDNLWCWSHMRRYFVRAGDAHPDLRCWVDGWLERIGALYTARTAMAAAEQGSADHRYAAAQFSAALNGIDVDRRAQAAAPGLHPAAAKVLATLDREWAGLVRHREFPEAPLDNNASERALRRPVVGRKNFYGSGSVVSAELAGATWTITATAERAGCNPLTYLTAYLDACAAAGSTAPTGDALSRFCPWAASTDDLTAWRQPGPARTDSTPPDADDDHRAPPGAGPAP